MSVTKDGKCEWCGKTGYREKRPTPNGAKMLCLACIPVWNEWRREEPSKFPPLRLD